MGDLNKRRGRVLGMNPEEPGYTEIEANVPMAEMQDFANTLRQMTQGDGSFTVKFERYEPLPGTSAGFCNSESCRDFWKITSTDSEHRDIYITIASANGG